MAKLHPFFESEAFENLKINPGKTDHIKAALKEIKTFAPNEKMLIYEQLAEVPALKSDVRLAIQNILTVACATE